MKKILVLTLTIGSLIGFAHAQAKDGPGPKHGKRFEELSSKLNLSADQQAQLKPVMDSTRQQMDAIRNDASLSKEQKREKAQETRKSTDSQIEAILTPEQKQQFQAMKAERRHNGPREHKQQGPGDRKHRAPGQGENKDRPGA